MNNDLDSLGNIPQENKYLKERISFLEKIIANLNNSPEYQTYYNVVKSLFDDVEDLIWIKDLDYKYIYANKSTCNLLLCTKNTNEPIGKRQTEFIQREKEIHPDNNNWYTFDESELNSDLKVLTNKESVRFEESSYIKGKLVCLDIYKSPLFNNDGKLIGLFGYAHELTKMKKLEIENQSIINVLKKEEENYNTLVSVIPDTVFRINKDEIFTDFHSNDAIDHLRAKKKIVGSCLADVYSAEISDKISCAIKKCLKSGISQILEYDIILNEDVYCYEARLFRVNKDEVLTLVRDITEKKASEIAYQESDKRYKELIDNSLLGFFIHQNCIIKYCNQKFANLFGYINPDNLIGMSFDRLVEPTDWTKLKEMVSECESGELEKIQLEFRGIKSDRSVIDLEVLGGKIFYSGNVAIQGSVADISIRKQAERETIKAKEKAEEMNRLKNSFLSSMSHELRTPLIGVMGFAEILSSDLEDPEQKSRANMIYESGARLLETLNQILDLSALEANIWVMNVKPVEVIETINLAMERFNEVAERKNLYLKLINPDETLYSSLDPKVFYQIMTNLIHNAIKYTNKGGVIVDVSKIKNKGIEWVLIKVIDTGIGISAENLDSIFEPFRQASEGYQRKYDGIGLGLTISKKLIEAMHGIIEVESKEKIGSTFKVRLPLMNLDENEQTQSDKSSNSIYHETIKRLKPKYHQLLFVEDDEINRSVVQEFLKDSCMLDITSTGENSVEMAKKKKYAAVLMDLKLAGRMNGLDAAKEIRKINGYSNVPIIAVTAYTLGGGKEGILKEGCSHYLPKPFSREKLIKLVEEILD